MHNEKELKDFVKWGKNPPEHTPHGTAADIEANMQRLQPNTWRMEGNKLIGMTAMGPLVQMIPTDYICHGTDDSGLPILKKVVL